MKIGIIGTGNITQYILDAVKTVQPSAEVVALFGRNRDVGPRLAQEYHTEFHTDFTQFLASPAELIVEAATIGVAKEHMADVLESGQDIILSSIGVFADEHYLQEMKQLAKNNGRHIYLPSGAIGGLDLLQSANSIGGLHEVSITTRKSYASLGLELKYEEECLFDGSARDAIEKFPKNVNVALLLSLAGLGADQTRVKVIADPHVQKNTHTINAHGVFGEMDLKIENEPMPNNPKTSYLAALSILSVLRNKGNSVTIGS